MAWIYFAISAYLLFAISAVIDKFLVSKVVRHPVAYAFYIGITGPFSLLLAPFGLKSLSLPDFFIAIISGVCLVLAIYYYFVAVQKTTVSRILPIQGGLTPLFTLFLALVLLGERLDAIQYIAFVFLVCGAVLISFKKESGQWHPVALKYVVLSSLLFALSAAFSKYIFDVSNYVSGMVWTRLGFFVTAMAFLASPQNRRYIFQAPKEAKTKNVAIYYSSRFLGTVGGFLQNFAVSIGSVTIVNALQGTQFIFLLVLTSFLSLRFPKVLRENISAAILSQKIAAIVLVTVGLVLLTL
ncbi:MAG: EamA family transporter [Candidatus Doudnabacteria bacterium]|nr:EamA family transporter [Candidatus Doudnabacteria bacterium]